MGAGLEPYERAGQTAAASGAVSGSDHRRLRLPKRSTGQDGRRRSRSWQRRRRAAHAPPETWRARPALGRRADRDQPPCSERPTP